MHHVVSSGTARLAVSEWGAVGGQTILALHPGVADRRIWATCADIWSTAGLHVVAYDRRGFGDTTYDPELHDELDDLRRVMDECVSGPVCVVGNSRGGGLALDFALAYADEVAALVLVSPSPSGYPHEEWVVSESEAEFDERIAAAEEAGDLGLVNRLEVHYWLDGVDQPEGRVSGAPRELMLDMNATALAADPPGNSIAPTPAWPRLSEVSVPTLVAVGEHDLPGCHTIGREMADAIPGARLEIIPDSAHCPPLDQPEAISESVLKFTRAVTGDPSPRPQEPRR